MIFVVIFSKKAKKQLQKVPRHIIESLAAWVDGIQVDGLLEVRKSPGYHDEPLYGERKGQRSVRLNRSYRAIYIIKNHGQIEFVSVEEVNKHEY